MRNLTRLSLTLFLTALCGAAVFARVQAKPTKTLTNAEIIRMVKAGVPDEIVVTSIQTTPQRTFDVTPDGLIALKQAGVSDTILKAMMSTGHPTAAAPPKSKATSTTVAPPPLKSGPVTEPPGIYLEQNGKLEPLEPTVVTALKNRNGFIHNVITPWAPEYKVAEVRGDRASLRLTTDPPTFYFYFAASATTDDFAGRGTAFVGYLSSASSPNEFVLMQMYQDRDKKVREMDYGKEGNFSSSTGVDSTNVVNLTIERLAPGKYKVVPAEKLGKGEFCFFYAAGATTLGAGLMPKLFDFGVD